MTTLQTPASPARSRTGRAATGAPVLLSLPWGLTAGGVATWAVRLANELASQGRGVALVLHRPPAEHAPIGFSLDPRVHVVDLSALPAVQGTGGDPAPFVRAYLEAVDGIARGDGPVVLAPGVLEECYGIAAAICQERPERVRVVAIQHSDGAFETRVMGRYEPIAARYVAVSRRIGRTLRAALPHRAGDVIEVPYGVHPAETLPRRAPMRGRALRLVYAGRMEHNQKRIRAIVHLSDALERRGVDHELLLLGDGPAAAEIDALIAARPRMRRLAAVAPERVAEHLDRADASVLASRFEGLSVSMLEAMARGCVPIVTGVASGVEDAIEDGVNGYVAPAAFDDAEEAVGEALARAVERFLAGDPHAAAHAAWTTIRERFSLPAHAEATARVMDDAAAAPPRRWPRHWPCVLGAATGGALGPGGMERAAALLESLAGRAVLIHGVGQHTLDLAGVLARTGANIVGFADDDAQRHGSRLWNWPVMAPADAAAAGATDVVISSHTHQEAIWSRRGVYESRGLRVHRIY